MIRVGMGCVVMIVIMAMPLVLPATLCVIMIMMTVSYTHLTLPTKRIV